MIERTIYLGFYIGMAFMIWKGIERLRWFGGSKEEESPCKDGTLWLIMFFSLPLMYMIFFHIIFLAEISQLKPTLPLTYINSYVGIVVLIVLLFLMLIRGFIKPTKNELITFFLYVLITILTWIFFPRSYDFIINPIYGFFPCMIFLEVLKHVNEGGNEELWELSKVWKVVNNRWFWLASTVFILIESVLQIQQLSIITVWFFL